MKDKNGNEIRNGDFLRIKFKMYDNKEQYDGIYQVILNEWSGAILKLIEIFEPLETFHTSLSWLRNELCVDYRTGQINPDYRETLAIDNKYQDISTGYQKDTILLRSYSTDIEIIKNY